MILAFAIRPRLGETKSSHLLKPFKQFQNKAGFRNRILNTKFSEFTKPNGLSL
jgi:hypothetical protein